MAAKTLEERVTAIEELLHILPSDGRCPTWLKEDKVRREKRAALMRPLLELWQQAHCLDGVLVFPDVPIVEQWAAEEILRLRAIAAGKE